ncbi:hypothetical protein M407DRAFT_245073 [Tulasnella calospora MUT 4182]|uniref:Uncharacterized protein n=1 Tax=Tulasnella calospora MUT 4182 TaxID=1051891 RepID=A0A0C3Q2I9_9AGAM|nr:hypothetical protein M407DRAFT_245073 [Tulasnella calospora MUT 4182]
MSLVFFSLSLSRMSLVFFPFLRNSLKPASFLRTRVFSSPIKENVSFCLLYILTILYLS